MSEIPYKSAILKDGSVLVLDGGYWGGSGVSFRKGYAVHSVIVSLKIIEKVDLKAFYQLSEGDRYSDTMRRTTVLVQKRGGGARTKAEYTRESRAMIREHGLREQFNRITTVEIV